MRMAGLIGASRRRGGPITTQRDKHARPAPDLVDRDFQADGPNRLWVADITYVPTAAGFFYLAVVVDVWSRRVVGWAMANHLRAELVVDALNMALGQRRPREVIHHSDQGSQYNRGAGDRRRRSGLDRSGRQRGRAAHPSHGICRRTPRDASTLCELPGVRLCRREEPAREPTHAAARAYDRRT